MCSPYLNKTITVKPVYNGPVLSGHSLLKNGLNKIHVVFNVIHVYMER